MADERSPAELEAPAEAGYLAWARRGRSWVTWAEAEPATRDTFRAITAASLAAARESDPCRVALARFVEVGQTCLDRATWTGLAEAVDAGRAALGEEDAATVAETT